MSLLFKLATRQRGRGRRTLNRNPTPPINKKSFAHRIGKRKQTVNSHQQCKNGRVECSDFTGTSAQIQPINVRLLLPWLCCIFGGIECRKNRSKWIRVVLSLHGLVSKCVHIKLHGLDADNAKPNIYSSPPHCTGRFGNQADHFLGSLRFAERLDRTLVLPPFIEYRTGELTAHMRPFDTYFNVSALQEFHRVRTMADFMRDEAPEIWPPERRLSLCYTERTALRLSNAKSTVSSAEPTRAGSSTAAAELDSEGCNAKDGNPFGPFWDSFGIDFASSRYYKPLSYDLPVGNHWTSALVADWKQRFGPDTPVLAFTGAPAAFPVQAHNVELQRYLRWTDARTAAAREYIRTALPRGAFLGIHLRNGADWHRACEHVPTSPRLFAAAQCLGYRNERGNLTEAMCMPRKDQIVRRIKRVIKESREAGPQKEMKSVFVASDSNHMVRELGDSLHRMRVSVHKLRENDPHMDLVVLGLANHFIGNCVSSFSAFVKRERDVRGFPSSFWGFPVERRWALDDGRGEEL